MKGINDAAHNPKGHMLALTKSKRTAAMKAYYAKLDELSNHKLDSPEYAACQQEVIDLIDRIAAEEKRSAFHAHLDRIVRDLNEKRIHAANIELDKWA